MDLEKNIQQLFSNDQSDIDADKFLKRLHHTRAIKHRNKQRLTYGLSTLAVVLFVVVLSITQITTDTMNYNSDYFMGLINCFYILNIIY